MRFLALAAAASLALAACDRAPPTTIPAPPYDPSTPAPCGSTNVGQVHCAPTHDGEVPRTR